MLIETVVMDVYVGQRDGLVIVVVDPATVVNAGRGERRKRGGRRGGVLRSHVDYWACPFSFFFFSQQRKKSKAAKLHFRCNKGWCKEGELDWLSAQGARGRLMSDEARGAI